jgi:gamma-glutamyltranspeptidase/glutathione hydrolase
MKRVVCALAVASQLIAGAAPARPDLLPIHWTDSERTAAEAREMAIMPSATRSLSGRTEMISATSSPVAVQAGLETLRQGGTAADAAVTTSLTQIAMMGGANVSYAGNVVILYYEARTRRVQVIDAGWNSWRGERDPKSIPASDISLITGKAAAPSSGADGRKTLVPGFMAGMEALHQRYGKLPWKRLFDPAIAYAENGVPVTPLLDAYFKLATPSLSKTPEGRAFLMPDGKMLPTTGTHFAAPGLASTLRAVAEHGAAEMYTGDWARAYVAMVREHGGAATMEDMAAYRPNWHEPLTVPVGDGVVVGPDANNSLGCAALMALNLLNHATPTGRYWEDARSLRDMAMATRLATTAPWSPEVAALDAKLGTGGGCAAHLRADFGASAMAQADALAMTRATAPVGHHSASVVVVDRWGNVAALIHSSNTAIWGDTGMVVGGIPLPVPAGIYQQRLAEIAPGGRMPSDQAPLMLLRNGAPALAVASVGSSTHIETVRLIYGLSRDADLPAWVAAPPLLLNIYQTSGPLAERDELVPPGRYGEALLANAKALGLPTRPVEASQVLMLRGTAALVRIGTDGERTTAEAPGVLTFGAGQ